MAPVPALELAPVAEDGAVAGGPALAALGTVMSALEVFAPPLAEGFDVPNRVDEMAANLEVLEKRAAFSSYRRRPVAGV